MMRVTGLVTRFRFKYGGPHLLSQFVPQRRRSHLGATVIRFQSSCRKPMARRRGCEGVISSLIAWNTALNWVLYFCSSASSLRESSSFAPRIRRKRTNARMISMFYEDRALAAKHGGQHRHALLRERIR